MAPPGTSWSAAAIRSQSSAIATASRSTISSRAAPRRRAIQRNSPRRAMSSSVLAFLGRGRDGLLRPRRAHGRGAKPGKILIDATTPPIQLPRGRSAPSSRERRREPGRRRPRADAQGGRGGQAQHLCRRRPGDHRDGAADPLVLRRHHRRCGALGAGTTCKLVNNSITIGMAALFAEGFATAAKLGVDLSRSATCSPPAAPTGACGR